MKILVFAAKYQYGHLYYDQKIIEALSELVELVVMCPPNWYSDRIKGVTYIECAVVENNNKLPHISLMYTTLKNYMLVNKLANKYKVDCIIAIEYELISIWYLVLLSRKKIFLIHHYNVDQLNQRAIFNFLFSVIKHKVRHIVIEQFIGNYLVDHKKVPSNHVYCWPHPVEELKDTKPIKHRYEKTYDCVGISNSNDDNIIHTIISQENETAKIKNMGYRIILRSHSETFDNGGLKVITGRLDSKTYDLLISGAKSIFICYPNTYVYRASGVIMDAVRNSIPVLFNDFELAKQYSKKYPSIFVVTNEQTLINDVSKLLNTSNQILESDFSKFISDHSDIVIKRAIKEALDNEFPF